ncbi:MAG: hypothetical protein CVT71_00225 [Alphaproteobacteria bacterium HGW-Alphaproteobacteria-10]|nr:MAG: hypothetical protein CVT71_00225 [Alphaproteobacteria bacterium HGW-Alphaproteobacteria-10]
MAKAAKPDRKHSLVKGVLSCAARAIRRPTQRPRRRLKNFAGAVAAAVPEAARGKPLEVWFQDEARVGQQGTLTRVRAKRGTRPRAPRDTRYQWACIFGAVRPERRMAAGLVMPFADTGAMNDHLAEISRTVAPGAHAVLVLDGAGWRGGHALVVPDNISLVVLPPYSPELNPVENVWRRLRANWLAIRIAVRPPTRPLRFSAGRIPPSAGDASPRSAGRCGRAGAAGRCRSP